MRATNFKDCIVKIHVRYHSIELSDDVRRQIEAFCLNQYGTVVKIISERYLHGYGNEYAKMFSYLSISRAIDVAIFELPDDLNLAYYFGYVKCLKDKVSSYIMHAFSQLPEFTMLE